MMFIIFLIFFITVYVMGIHLNCINFHLNCINKSNAIQMGTHNICLYKEIDQKYTGCNLKTSELPHYASTMYRGICGNYVEYGNNVSTYHLLNFLPNMHFKL